uniref:Uncharacterized protein n=1 Tax=Eptatretus burgeri TaxID=7764 RepID=A0A8C4NG47_EPTBU
MCQPQNIGRIITSRSNFIRIFFHSDLSITGRGFNVTLSTQDACIPANLTVTSYNSTSITLSWVVPEDQNNTFFSFVSLFSSANKIQNYTTTNKELTFTGLSPGTTYSVSVSSLCNGTESIPSTNDVQTGPNPPLNITVVEQGVLFAFVRWTAPNDPNKDSYRYLVTWSRNGHSISTTVYSTERNITSLVPGKNYTVTVTSSYISTYSQPATTTFIAVPCGGRVRTGRWLSSPGYPQYIYSNIDCVWDIEAPLGHVVSLTVVDLDYYSNSWCYRGWLAVRYNHTSQRDITMCRYSDVGRTIISPSNTMRIFYHSTYYYGTERFNVTLSSQETTISAPDKTTQPGSSATTLHIPTTSRATGETTISPPDTTPQTMSSSTTHLVSPTSATSSKTSSLSGGGDSTDNVKFNNSPCIANLCNLQ